jgi:hypothetical protein
MMIKESGFRKWLEANMSVEVGIPGRPCLCPVARYVQFVTKKWSSVDTICICTLTGGYDATRNKTPPWAANFIRRIDRMPLLKSVTGAQALVALDESQTTQRTVQ